MDAFTWMPANNSPTEALYAGTAHPTVVHDVHVVVLHSNRPKETVAVGSYMKKSPPVRRINAPPVAGAFCGLIEVPEPSRPRVVGASYENKFAAVLVLDAMVIGGLLLAAVRVPIATPA